MRYVKIRAKTYNEAMMKLKADYGDEAIPISHKYVKEGGLFNSKFFSKQVVELTAGVQEGRSTAGKINRKSTFDFTVGDKKGSSGYGPGSTAAEKKSDVKLSGEINMDNINRRIDDLNSNLNDLISKKSGNIGKDTAKEKKAEKKKNYNVYSKSSAAQKNESKDSDHTEKEPAEAGFLRDESVHRIKKPEVSAEKTDKNEAGEISYLKRYDDLLEKNDFNNSDRSKILSEVRDKISKEELRDRYKIEKSLKELIKSRIVTTGPIQTGNNKKVIMFVGPTGVGKTTTMAKLGALYSLRKGKKVVFITIDNYRIAATEQLKKYAEIMKIPIHAVNDQKDFKDIISREKADIIMIDTSGRSHKNSVKILEMKEFTDQVDYDFEKVLCVSANIKKADLNEIFRSFDVIDLNSIIITKVDETSFVGNVIDIADKYNKPISYYTNGQEVPNDIEVADSDKIVDMMFGNVNN